MAKTLDEAGVKRLIQEIKGANKNLNTPIPISTENTTESMAQNVKNIADYVEKAKAAGIASVNGMAVTCLIDNDYSGVGYLYGDTTNVTICGIMLIDDAIDGKFFSIHSTGEYYYNIIISSGDGNVNSCMLDQGARNPIILTPDTTEVDEETYQKLLSDDVDVLFKTLDGEFCTLTYKTENNDNLGLVFSCFSVEGETDMDVYIYGYDVSITKNSPHNCSISEQFNNDFTSLLTTAGVVNKSTLSSVLQEIDLTGTDAKRKAKLDKFEADWKALTGTVNPRGARFIGKVNSSEIGVTTVLLCNNINNNTYEGIIFSDDFSAKIQSVSVDRAFGSLTITPLFSHLEAITIYTDNTPKHMEANLANITAYEANLQALGVNTEGYKAPIIPIYTEDSECHGFIQRNDTGLNNWTGICTDQGWLTQITISIDSGEATVLRVALYEDVVDKTLNAKSLEAITIKTSNSTTDKAANVAAIKEYVDNLKLLGVDTTKGYVIPIRTSDGIIGVVYFDNNNNYRGFGRKNTYSYSITILQDGTYNIWFLLDNSNDYAAFTTINKKIVGAINEVNALAKSKQDKLTSGTNIKTVNGQSLLGSGDIAISGGGGSAPVLVNIDDISGSIGSSVSVDVFNTIANAASAKTPIFGYSELVEGSKATYEIIPLYVKNISTITLSIQFVRASAYNSVLINRNSDTKYIILFSVSRTFALDTSVDKSSTKGVQSNAVWNEIHSEPMTVNTATSGVTTLSSTDKHKILCYADSGTQQYNLPPSPVDGETFLFLKVNSGHAITIQSGTGNENIYDCSSGNSVVSKTIETSTKRKITITYSSTVGKWLLMTDDFIS